MFMLGSCCCREPGDAINANVVIKSVPGATLFEVLPARFLEDKRGKNHWVRDDCFLVLIVLSLSNIAQNAQVSIMLRTLRRFSSRYPGV